MNALTLTEVGSLTMSSTEIAALCDKNHSHVIRDIRAMIDALGDDPDLVHVQESKDSRGYTSTISLPKDLTLTLVAGYSVKLRKRIIDRWLELEAAPAFNPASLSRMDILTMALESEKKALLLEHQVQELAPSSGRRLVPVDIRCLGLGPLRNLLEKSRHSSQCLVHSKYQLVRMLD